MPTPRRGSAAVVVALALFVLLGFAALVVDLGYAWAVRVQLQNLTDAAAHAAVMELDGTDAGVAASRSYAVSFAAQNPIEGQVYTLSEDEVQFGYYDDDGGFHETDQAIDIEAVRVTASVPDVGLGLAAIAFGIDGVDVSARAGVVRGPGDASTGDQDGPGLRNGHFDLDTTKASTCPATSSNCTKTTKHTHEYDDQFDTTWVDFFDVEDPSHVEVSEAITASQQFKIIVGNADLSPGAWMVINGEEYPVQDYDDTRFADLTTWSLDGSAGSTRLTQFELWFDVDSIANCELIPTNTGDVRKNQRGPDGEWRNGALTLLCVKTTATPSVALSAGGVTGVATPAGGMLWEATTFWHWDGPSYHESDWQDEYDGLICSTPRFVE